MNVARVWLSGPPWTLMMQGMRWSAVYLAWLAVKLALAAIMVALALTNRFGVLWRIEENSVRSFVI